MLTPVDIQNKVFKGGIGFDKRDVEAFMHELSSDYEQLYRSNVELNDKVTTLNESLQHYKSVEDSMQKALTLSEKTAEETVNAANDKARLITTEAEKKAESILEDAKQELIDTKNEIFRLQQQQKKFKEQFTHVLESQLKMMDGEMIDIDLGDDFEPEGFNNSGFGNFSGGGLGSEGGLGSGLGGGYTGSNNSGFERTNQDPAYDRGTLNMDPFADAMNGGGRFSRQTGGAYNGNQTKKKSTKTDSGKSGLNMKQDNPGAHRVKRTPVQTTPVANTPAADSTTEQTTMHTAQTTPVQSASTQDTTIKSSVTSQAAPESAIPAEEKEPVFHTAPSTNEHTYTDTPYEETSVSGEVEDKVNESNMLDSEDNYSDGFDFVEDNTTSDPTTDSSVFFSAEPVSGEVEDKIDESTMLDSEDNYGDGFDFMDEEPAPQPVSPSPVMNTPDDSEDETYSGEVEDKVNESNMLDSEDNYNDGFDFVVGNDEEEEIPTISGNTSLNLDPFHEKDNSSSEDEDVLTGDVEDKINESNLIGSEDDNDAGFNFL